MNQVQLQSQAQTSVMKSALDNAEQQGDAMVNMIQQSSVPQNAPLEAGQGQQVDLLA
jgi:hypothetical protein